MKHVFFYENSISRQEFFFTEYGKIIPKLFQILKCATFYANE